MDPEEMREIEKLAGKDYIERKGEREVIKGKDGKERIIKDTQKITGLDGAGAITYAELKRIKDYACACPSKGIENYGGTCRICGATFCNTKENENRYTCSKKCMYCHKRICMDHVRGIPGDDIFCSPKCYLLFKLRFVILRKLRKPLILVIGVIILLAIIFSLFR